MSQRALIELLYGKGAHADPIACAEDLSAGLAARHLEGFPHSIGQLVFHMNYWLDYELRRIRGERPVYPEHASESWPPAPSPADAREWDRLRQQLSAVLTEYAGMAQWSAEQLQRPVESAHPGDAQVAGSVEAVLWQMVAHTSYHVGQIALIRRVLGAWPPRRGGDTW